MTRSTRHAHRALTVAAGVALLALPAMAAVHDASGGAPGATAAVADAAATDVTAVPAGSTASGATGDASGPAPTATTVGAVAGEGTEGAAAPVAVPSDESGSTEAVTVQRSCGAEADSHYEPPSGAGQSECMDADGNFDPSRTYTATHHTNDVQCGSDNVLVPVDPAGAYVSGDGDAGADGADGYLSACSEGDLPINGRATVQGEGDPSGDLAVSGTADGDKDNPEETSQGWVTATVTPSGPEYRCGKAYAEGGRANSDAPTSEDTAEECG